MPPSNRTRNHQQHQHNAQNAANSNAASAAAAAATSFLSDSSNNSSAEQSAAEARANALMSRSIVGKHPESIYTSYSNGGIRSKEERVAAARTKKTDKKDTLSQWFGMKRFSKNMSRAMRQDLELLRYRNFLSKDTAHLSSARGVSKKNSPYFELGYFTDVSSKKRREYKRFADEMMAEDPELKERVDQVSKREIRRRKKVQEKAARKREILADKIKMAELRKRGSSGGNNNKKAKKS